MKKFLVSLVICGSACAPPPSGLVGQGDEMALVRVYLSVPSPIDGIQLLILDKSDPSNLDLAYIPASCDVRSLPVDHDGTVHTTCVFRWRKDTAIDMNVQLFAGSTTNSPCSLPSSGRQSTTWIQVQRDYDYVGYELRPIGNAGSCYYHVPSER